MTSHALRIREVRRIDRIVGECLELWFDATAWQTHLLREAARLLDLRVGLLAEIDDFDPGQTPRLVTAIEHGWDDAKQRAAFFNSAAPGGNEPFGISPVDLRFRDLLKPRRAVTRTRSDLIANADWLEHFIYLDIHRPAGMDDFAYSAIRQSRSRVNVLALGGDESQPGPRQRKALALLHREIASRMGRKLATMHDPGRHRLTPRQREVFDLLITDASECDIMTSLKRSRSTITQHVAAIYDHFHVNSRSQLLANLLHRELRH
ncbi:MAG: LuxR C-terminal-related transcriptional regulator [Phycisphaeraceae bacterium]